jgi:fucose permease
MKIPFASLFLAVIYMAFISLGLPDSVLGASWPVSHTALGASLDFAGAISLLCAFCTILSSISASYVIGRFGTRKVTAVSIFLTAAALLGQGLAPSLWFFVLLAIPLGLGGGAIDTGLNDYVAKHYKARHMSWLHCCWGLGALIGPLIIGSFLSRGGNWRGAYRTLSIIQFCICAIVAVTIPIWNRAGIKDNLRETPEAAVADKKKTSLFSEVGGNLSLLRNPVVLAMALSFFFYCSTEYTLSLWGASFLFSIRGFSKANAARAVSLFYIGITTGRFLNGFLTFKFHGKSLIRVGLCLITAGAALLFLPLPPAFSPVCFFIVGLGCAPIFPTMLQLNPERFGADISGRVTGVCLAFSYAGSMLVPVVEGICAARISFLIIPGFLFAFAAIMLALTEFVNRKTRKGK